MDSCVKQRQKVTNQHQHEKIHVLNCATVKSNNKNIFYCIFHVHLIIQLTNMHVFGLLEGARVPGVKPRRRVQYSAVQYMHTR